MSKQKKRPKDLILIVAREFASRLATAVLVTDADGNLVYFNEPAERLVGRTFAETGELAADDWVKLFRREERDGSPLPVEHMPSRIALHERRPAHREFVFTGLDGVRRELSATAFPLLSSDMELIGVVSIFWEQGKRGRVRAIVRGCRGSLATPGPRTLRRGGNTSCVEIRLADGTLLILDAGTGIRELGVELAGSPGRGPIHLVLTHLHLDHLEGLGFFVPLWQPETELHIWGPRSTRESLRSRIARFLAPPFFPVLLADAPSDITFHDVPGEPWTIGAATITAQPVLHPGPTVGYRVEADRGVLVYLPDHEPYLGGQRPDIGTDWISGFDLAHDADVLMHDAQFTEAEYPAKVGWGHSSVAQAVEFAKVTGVKRLLLFHHDPLHDEEQLDAIEARAFELWDGYGLPPTLAVEGSEHVLGTAA